MTTHELAKELLEKEDVEVGCSVDVSTCDEDSGRRVFGSEACEILFANGCFNY